MSDFLSTFLDQQDEVNAIEMPVGEGFAPGFIGPVMGAIRYMFWTRENLDEAGVDGIKGAYTHRGKEGSNFYYFQDRELGSKAADALGAYAPRMVWRFEIPTGKVLNFGVENAEETWGATVGGDVRISTLRSKYRHEFHAMALPAAVAVLALRMGYVGADSEWASGYDLSELLDENLIVDEEFEMQMIGNNAGTFRKSVLWQRRADLWKALGEEDPEAYNPIGAGTKFDTTSEQLSNCLQIATRVWTKPLWARMVLVPDPRLAAVYGEGTRLSIPILVKVFADKKAAEEAAAEEATASTETSKADDDSDKYPDLPEEWAGYRSEFIAEVAKHKDNHNDVLPKKKELKAIAEGLDCTANDIVAWWEFA